MKYKVGDKVWICGEAQLPGCDYTTPSGGEEVVIMEADPDAAKLCYRGLFGPFGLLFWFPRYYVWRGDPAVPNAERNLSKNPREWEEE